MNTTLTRRRDPSPTLEEICAMTDEQANAVDIDSLHDAVYADLEKREALLTIDDVRTIGLRLEKGNKSERATLALLTKSFSWLDANVNNDRQFAFYVADAQRFAEHSMAFYEGLASMMREVSTRAEFALAGRGDREEILAELVGKAGASTTAQ